VTIRSCDALDGQIEYVGSWHRVNDIIQIQVNKIDSTDGKELSDSIDGSIRSMHSKFHDLASLHWVSEPGFHVNGNLGTFDGTSIKVGNVTAIDPLCGDEIISIGQIAIVFDPARKNEFLQYTKKNHLKIGTVTDEIDNLITIEVPIGTENDEIMALNQVQSVYQAQREPATLDPGFSWVTLQKGVMYPDGTSLQHAKEIITNVVADALGANSKIELSSVGPKLYDLSLKGPVTTYISDDQYKNFWLAATFELMIDQLEKVDRLVGIVKDARIVSWSDARSDKPPAGAGIRLSCSAEAPTQNWSVPTAILQKIFDTTSARYGGIEISNGGC
jgi:hypothetical protein